MATRGAGHDSDLWLLRALVKALGVAHVVYLLAQIVEDDREAARLRQDMAGADRCVHDAKVLGEAAIRLLG